jgi:hypothetical protein
MPRCEVLAPPLSFDPPLSEIENRVTEIVERGKGVHLSYDAEIRGNRIVVTMTVTEIDREDHGDENEEADHHFIKETFADLRRIEDEPFRYSFCPI